MNLGWVVAALLGAATVGLLIDRARSESPSAAPLQLHAFMPPPEGMYLTSTLALSRDGGRLAFVAADATGKRRLWVQSLRTPTPQMLADTNEANDPFWSPDGEHVAFFAGRRLKRVPAGGGAVTTLCEIGAGAGGTWNADNVIVFAQLEGPLMRVSAGGGRPEPITALDRDRVETHHLYPNFLPDGRHFVFYVNSRERGLYVGAVDSDRRTRLFDPDPALPAGAAPTPGVYSSSGHLLYVRDRVLMARRFDPTTFQVSGEPLTIVKTVDYDPPGQAAFTSANGILIYRARHHRPLAVLEWVDRAGRALGEIASPPGTFRTLSLSPDGRTVAIDRLDAQGLPSVWVIDTAQGTSARLTSTYWSGDPLWSHDGRLLAYSVAADSPPNIVIRADGGRGPERRITRQPTEQHYAASFTPEGRHLVFHAISATTGHDLYLASIVEDNVLPQRLLQTSANESHGRVSPDGRWLVYVSDESGQREVYLSPFPELQGRTLLSWAGGIRPFWRRDGREVFYLSADGRVMAVPLTPSPTTLVPGKPTELFRATLYENVYTPDADGRRFLVARPAPATETVPFEILVNPFR